MFLKKKKPIYEEYIINSNYFKKLYNMYLDKKVIHKVLDILVFLAIILTVMAFVMDHLLGINNIVLYTINSFFVLILFIFILELLREYAKSHSTKGFFKQHWIDFTLISVLSLYFVVVTVFGFAKFFMLNFMKAEATEAKYFRAIYNLFRR